MINTKLEKSFRLTRRNSYEILSKTFIKKTVRRICKNSCIRYVILFGSYSRNEAHALSDIDLLIGLDLNPIEYAKIYLKLKDELKKPLDIYFLNHILKKDEIKTKFLQDFTVLYFKKDNIKEVLKKLES